MKKFLKPALIILLIAILGGCVALEATDVLYIKKTDKSDYEACVEKCYNSEKYLPNTKDILENENFKYKYYEDLPGLFMSYRMVVMEEVSAEELKNREEYRLVNSPVCSEYIEDNVISDDRFKIDDYSFAVLYDEESQFPQEFGLVAVSKKGEQNTVFCLL